MDETCAIVALKPIEPDEMILVNDRPEPSDTIIQLVGQFDGSCLREERIGGAGYVIYAIEQGRSRVLALRSVCLPNCSDNIEAEIVACQHLSEELADTVTQLLAQGYHRPHVIIQGDILPVIKYFQFAARLRRLDMTQPLEKIRTRETTWSWPDFHSDPTQENLGQITRWSLNQAPDWTYPPLAIANQYKDRHTKETKRERYRLILVRGYELDWLRGDLLRKTREENGVHNWIPKQDLPFTEIVLYAYAADCTPYPTYVLLPIPQALYIYLPRIANCIADDLAGQASQFLLAKSRRDPQHFHNPTGAVSIKPALPAALFQAGGFQIQSHENPWACKATVLVEIPYIDHGLLRRHLALKPSHRQILESYLSPRTTQQPQVEIAYSPRCGNIHSRR